MFKKMAVSATSIYNYLIRDPLVDYLKSRPAVRVDEKKPEEKEKKSDQFQLSLHEQNLIESSLFEVKNIIQRQQELILCQKQQIQDLTEQREQLYLSDEFTTNKNSSYSSEFIEFIMKQGIAFENQVIKYLNLRHKIVTVSRYYSEDMVKKSIEYMRQGVPILHSVPMKNSQKGVYGIADLIVRSDYLQKLFPEMAFSELNLRGGSKLCADWFYVCIDIKFSTLPLAANGMFLCNSGNYPAYKGQLCIYNWCLEEIQHIFPKYGFIMGRRWGYTSKGQKYHGDVCDQKLGVIDFTSYDQNYLEKTQNAIDWVREVRLNAGKWKLSPVPERIELYPNMSSDNGCWQQTKSELADQIGELTTIWNVGPACRNKALEKGINNWRLPNCTAESLGFSGERAKAINAILEVNRTPRIYYPESMNKNRAFVIPDEKEIEFFVDFETLPDIFGSLEMLPKSQNTEMIFMIGIGWKENSAWKYLEFTAESISKNAERKIMEQFLECLGNFPQNRLWHWSPAEPRFWNHAITRHPGLETVKLNWLDLADIFMTEPIAIKGCFDYSLKHVVGAVYKNNLLNNGKTENPWQSDCKNGLDASIQAFKVYQIKSPFPINQNPIMKDIIKYNEIDCQGLADLLTFIRSKLLTLTPQINATPINRIATEAIILAHRVNARDDRDVQDIQPEIRSKRKSNQELVVGKRPRLVAG